MELGGWVMGPVPRARLGWRVGLPWTRRGYPQNCPWESSENMGLRGWVPPAQVLLTLVDPVTFRLRDGLIPLTQMDTPLNQVS